MTTSPRGLNLLLKISILQLLQTFSSSAVHYSTNNSRTNREQPVQIVNNLEFFRFLELANPIINRSFFS